MQTLNNTQDRLKALGLTIVIILLLLLFLLFFKIITPLPPFPPSVTQELEIAFESGGGDESEGETNTASSIVQASAKHHIEAASEEKIVTNTSGEDIAINPTAKPNKITPSTLPPAPAMQTIEEPIPSPELASVLSKLKNKMKGNGGTGNNSNGAGNGAGDGGTGKGNGGTGNGTGTGNGNGQGNYYLKGRSLVKSPELIYDTQEEGKVIVEIFVDETGKVIKATPGQRGSTTTSSVLFAKARQAALSMKYDASADGTKEQKGFITIVFTLD